MSGKISTRMQLENALYAFHEGLHTINQTPTLGALAFFAALASFADEKCCEGQVTCSQCGPRPKHASTGEVNRILDELVRIFSELNWPKENVRKLLRSFHGEQRSAYVHRAKRAISRKDSTDHVMPLWPSETSSVHPDIMRLDEIRTVECLSRLVIVHALCDLESAIVPLLDRLKREFGLRQTGSVAALRFPWGLEKPIHLGFPWPEEFGRSTGTNAGPTSVL